MSCNLDDSMATGGSIRYPMKALRISKISKSRLRNLENADMDSSAQSSSLPLISTAHDWYNCTLPTSPGYRALDWPAPSTAIQTVAAHVKPCNESVGAPVCLIRTLMVYFFLLLSS